MPAQNNDRNPKQQIQAIFSDDCEQFDELLTPYAHAQIHGEAIGEQFAELIEHLATCPDCRDVYDRLLTMLALENSKKWEIPDIIPFFPLPEVDVPSEAMPEKVEANTIRKWQEVGGVKVWLKKQEQSIVRLWVNLAEMRPVQLAFRASEMEQSEELALAADLSQLNPNEPLQFRVNLVADSTRPHRCSLQVEINLPNHWPDFSGTEVLLHLPEQQVQSAITRGNGYVLFQNLDKTLALQSQLEIIPHYDTKPSSE